MLKELDFDFYHHADITCYYNDNDNDINEKLIYQKLKDIISLPSSLPEEDIVISPYSLIQDFVSPQEQKNIKKGDFFYE